MKETNLQNSETIEKLLNIQSTYTRLESIQKILNQEYDKGTVIHSKFRKKFGLPLYSLESDVLQRFYEMGLQDANIKSYVVGQSANITHALDRMILSDK
jgi:hypothetical protein